MRTLDELSKEEIKEYLGKGWLTHDGMWFYTTYRELGIDLANRLNKKAIKSMSYFEIERTKRILDIENTKIDSFEALVEFLLRALELIIPHSIFSKAHFSIPSKNIIHWEWENNECFAYKGVKRLGIVDQYECGVIYRIECFFDTLGIKYTVNPKVENCLMAEKGRCSGDFVFYFDI